MPRTLFYWPALQQPRAALVSSPPGARLIAKSCEGGVDASGPHKRVAIDRLALDAFGSAGGLAQETGMPTTSPTVVLDVRPFDLCQLGLQAALAKPICRLPHFHRQSRRYSDDCSEQLFRDQDLLDWFRSRSSATKSGAPMTRLLP